MLSFNILAPQKYSLPNPRLLPALGLFSRLRRGNLACTHCPPRHQATLLYRSCAHLDWSVQFCSCLVLPVQRLEYLWWYVKIIIFGEPSVQSSVEVCNRSRAKSCLGNIVESLWGHGGGLAYFTHSELRFVRLNSCNRLQLHASLQCSSAFIFVFCFFEANTKRQIQWQKQPCLWTFKINTQIDIVTASKTRIIE